MQSALILKPGRHQRLAAGHPWVYRTDAASIPECDPGETVPFALPSGEILAWGYVNGKSAIPGRAFQWGAEPPDEDWLTQKLKAAVALRARLGGGAAERLVFSEGDGLPGLIIDRYGALCVASETTAGMAARREVWLAALKKIVKPARIYLRNSSPVLDKEGIPRESKWLLGDTGNEPVTIAGVKYEVDPEAGHKTGMYLDQRKNHEALASLVRPGDSVLDLFCHQGGFALAALRAGAARATGVDSSGPALAGARAHALRNGLEKKLSLVEADVAKYLNECHQQFSLVVLDPPPLAKKSSELQAAYPKYLRLHAAASRAVAPGGLLLTFACSEAVDWETLLKLARGGAQRAGRMAKVLTRLTQPPDHPWNAACPEGEYLRGLVLALD